MIREATRGDIEEIIGLAFEMHQESRYCVMEFDVEKVVGFLVGCIEHEDYLLLVAEKGGKIIGGFAGFVMEQWFSHDLFASDFALFVSPDRRGGMVAAQLVKAFTGWAKVKGCKMIQLGISTGVKVKETGKLYERLGYENYGELFEYKGIV